jgi:hypothetical protein
MVTTNLTTHPKSVSSPPLSPSSAHGRPSSVQSQVFIFRAVRPFRLPRGPRVQETVTNQTLHGQEQAASSRNALTKSPIRSWSSPIPGRPLQKCGATTWTRYNYQTQLQYSTRRNWISPEDSNHRSTGEGCRSQRRNRLRSHCRWRS